MRAREREPSRARPIFYMHLLHRLSLLRLDLLQYFSESRAHGLLVVAKQQEILGTEKQHDNWGAVAKCFSA